MDLPHTPRYPFGFGLSYTAFAYSDLKIDKESVPTGESVTVSCTIKNTGSRERTEIVQLYCKDEFASMIRPVKELMGVCWVRLTPGEEKRITFALSTSQLTLLDEDMKWKIEHGEIQVQIGDSSEDIRLTGNFQIEGDQWIDGKTRAFYAKVSIEKG